MTATDTPAVDTPAPATPATPAVETLLTSAATAPEATPATETAAAESGGPKRGPDGKFLPKEATVDSSTAIVTDTATVETAGQTTPAVPETYELALPKDSPLPADSLERTAAVARSLGLTTNEAAQQLVEAVNAEALAVLKAKDDAHAAAWKPGEGPEWKRQDAEWRTQALKDAEIGGTPDKLKASSAKAAQVITRFGNDGIMKFLNDTGLGSHPDFVRLFARIGNVMSEGALALGTPPAPAATRKPGELFYENNGEGPKRIVETAA